MDRVQRKSGSPRGSGDKPACRWRAGWRAGGRGERDHRRSGYLERRRQNQSEGAIMSTVAETNIATNAKVVQVRGVSKIFKRDAFRVTALDDVSIDIGKGEFLALMGPSGSGKTTLLNMIAAIDRPTSGELLVQGQDIFRFSDRQSARW